MDAPPLRRPAPRAPTPAGAGAAAVLALCLAVLCCAHPAAGEKSGDEDEEGTLFTAYHVLSHVILLQCDCRQDPQVWDGNGLQHFRDTPLAGEKSGDEDEEGTLFTAYHVLSHVILLQCDCRQDPQVWDGNGLQHFRDTPLAGEKSGDEDEEGTLFTAYHVLSHVILLQCDCRQDPQVWDGNGLQHFRDTPLAGANWGYKGLDGPEYWGGLCQTGSEQSPVPLDEASASVVRHPPLVFFSYNADSPASAVNNGHTVEVRLVSQCPVAVVSGGLPGVYLLEQLHFHWEAEHVVSGKRWPLELHFVHRNERYASLQEALRDREGVAVVAVLFHVSDVGSHAMEVIGDAVRKISVSPGASLKLTTSIKLKELLPKDTHTFYRYHGSLTTPGCNESVVWTVFPNTVPVTKQQMEAFHRVRGVDLTPLGINYRPLQPVNGREIQLNSAPVIVPRSLHLSIFVIVLITLHSQL